ncbi:MAG: hypothetical protein U9R75_06180 [Candidatus Thermoplasmatota archaeon]|nr:hypothetical protein [Candidatus Thermoplasmatota archaeon]
MTDDGMIKSLNDLSIRLEQCGMGLYEVIGLDGEVLYVGVGNLRFNLHQHLPNGWFPINEGRYYRRKEIPPGEPLDQCLESLLSEYERENGSAPKYNRNFIRSSALESDDLVGLI